MEPSWGAPLGPHPQDTEGPRASGATRADGLPSPSANLPVQHMVGGALWGACGALTSSLPDPPTPTPQDQRKPVPALVLGEGCAHCPDGGHAHGSSRRKRVQPAGAHVRQLGTQTQGETDTDSSAPPRGPRAQSHGHREAPCGPGHTSSPREQRFRSSAGSGDRARSSDCRHQLISWADGGRTGLGPSARPQPHSQDRPSPEWADTPPSTSRARDVCPGCHAAPGTEGNSAGVGGRGQRMGRALALKAPTCPVRAAPC